MKTLGQGYRALVIGSSGAIGGAFIMALRADPACAEVVALSRSTHPDFSLENESSIAQVAEGLKSATPFSLIIDATGALTIDGHGPEKSLNALNAERLLRSFQINAVGPALLLKYFLPLLGTRRAVYAKLSARVGSISDNKKGGWYGYRASKAALNMLLQTAAIEWGRKNPAAVIAALQPGTVQSALSKPFVGQDAALLPQASVEGLLAALDQLGMTSETECPTHKGAYFIDYQGKSIPW
ncbi:SDR family NAD(P)-dependent oxidoreductase [Zwartia sp.]|uniref:SDR family NAD(P)-dependent oxidoreductase n=1 Tax=Zwartia sp. TaxID=2978004 RepID=UPI003BB16D5C